MDKNRIVVTVSREYGSGGRIIGRRIADELGLAFYDKELIEMIARESGFREDVVSEAEKKMHESRIHAAYDVTFNAPMTDLVFRAESKLIRELADKGPCVLIGRCSDYILRGRSGCLNVFVYASEEEKIRRAVDEYGVEERNVRDVLRRLDKDRAAYYDYYTNDKWGNKANYHLALNSGIGIDACVEIIKTAIRSASL